jgi:Na+/H+ antiporter NhaD/arsenite permease-like protein
MAVYPLCLLRKFHFLTKEIDTQILLFVLGLYVSVESLK